MLRHTYSLRPCSTPGWICATCRSPPGTLIRVPPCVMTGPARTYTATPIASSRLHGIGHLISSWHHAVACPGPVATDVIGRAVPEIAVHCDRCRNWASTAPTMLLSDTTAALLIGAGSHRHRSQRSSSDQMRSSAAGRVVSFAANRLARRLQLVQQPRTVR